MPVLIELPDEQEFTKLYMSGVSTIRLIFKYYVSANTIYRWVNKFGISRRSKDLQKQDLERLLNNKLTYKKIGEQLNCSAQTVREYLVKYGLAEIHPIKNKSKRKLINKDELYNLRINETWTYTDLAQHFHVSKMTIHNRCKEYKFPIVSRNNSNHYWRKEFKLYKTS